MYSTKQTEVTNGSGTGSTWFFNTSQGDVVPELDPMLAPHNFDLEVNKVLHGVAGFDPPGGHQVSRFRSKQSPKRINE